MGDKFECSSAPPVFRSGTEGLRGHGLLVSCRNLQNADWTTKILTCVHHIGVPTV